MNRHRLVIEAEPLTLEDREILLKCAEHASDVCRLASPLRHAGRPIRCLAGRCQSYDGARHHNWIERAEHYELIARVLIERAMAGMPA